MNDEPAIDWPARLARALAHVERLNAEWAEAAKQRRCARWVRYDYAVNGQKEGEHNHAELENRMDYTHV